MTGQDRARQMYANGTLTEDAVRNAVSEGKRAFVLAALELITGLSENAVHSLASSINPKAVVALVWKAGYSMEFAEQFQIRLANIPPKRLFTRPKKVIFRSVKISFPGLSNWSATTLNSPKEMLRRYPSGHRFGFLIFSCAGICRSALPPIPRASFDIPSQCSAIGRGPKAPAS